MAIYAGKELVKMPGSDEIYSYHVDRVDDRKVHTIFSKGLQRLREIERLIHHRFHGPIPPSHLGVKFVKEAAYSKADICVHDWCRKWAAWADYELIETAVRIAAGRDNRSQMDIVGKRLEVTLIERRSLSLKSIGSEEQTRAEREASQVARKKKYDADRRARIRRVAGCKSRMDYEAGSLSQKEPWVPLGISRRTWERQRKAKLENAVVASQSSIENLTGSSISQDDALATTDKKTTTVECFLDGSPENSIADNETGTEGRCWGLGTTSPIGIKRENSLWLSSKNTKSQV